MPSAKEVILWRAGHSPKIFVEKVDFVTSAGNVSRVVSPLCIFRREGGRLVLDSIHPGVERSQLAERTGLRIQNLDTAPTTPEPTAKELSALREIDPDGVRYAEFNGHRK
jgi:glutaconate CoA-transferase subunit B